MVLLISLGGSCKYEPFHTHPTEHSVRTTVYRIYLSSSRYDGFWFRSRLPPGRHPPPVRRCGQWQYGHDQDNGI